MADYSKISSNVTIIPGSPSGYFSAIEHALKTIYEGSPSAAAAIDNWLKAHPGQNIEIAYQKDTANDGPPGAGKVHIDDLYTTDKYYLSENGNAVGDTLLSALTRELGHAILGKLDIDSYADLAGGNIVAIRPWFLELGLETQASYEGYSDSAHLIAGKSYTFGNAVKKCSRR